MRSAKLGGMAAALATLVVACGGPQAQTATLDSVAGCYAFVRPDSPRLLVRMFMPDTLMLDTALQMNSDGRPSFDYPNVLRPVSRRPGGQYDTLWSSTDTTIVERPSWDQYYVLKVWRFTPPDSVTARLHQNMGPSWTLNLRVVGDSLLGEADYADDASLDFTVPLAAKRVACPPRSPAL